MLVLVLNPATITPEVATLHPTPPVPTDDTRDEVSTEPAAAQDAIAAESACGTLG